MERLVFLLAVWFVILAALLVRSRRKAAPGASAAASATVPPTVAPIASASEPAPVPVPGPPAATVAATAAHRLQGAGGARDPYARLGACPSCGRPLVERVGKRGALKGKPYLVCSGDPPCATLGA